MHVSLLIVGVFVDVCIDAQCVLFQYVLLWHGMLLWFVSLFDLYCSPMFQVYMRYVYVV